MQRTNAKSVSSDLVSEAVGLHFEGKDEGDGVGFGGVVNVERVVEAVACVEALPDVVDAQAVRLSVGAVGICAAAEELQPFVLDRYGSTTVRSGAAADDVLDDGGEHERRYLPVGDDGEFEPHAECVAEAQLEECGVVLDEVELVVEVYVGLVGFDEGIVHHLRELPHGVLGFLRCDVGQGVYAPEGAGGDALDVVQPFVVDGYFRCVLSVCAGHEHHDEEHQCQDDEFDEVGCGNGATGGVHVDLQHEGGKQQAPCCQENQVLQSEKLHLCRFGLVRRHFEDKATLFLRDAALCLAGCLRKAWFVVTKCCARHTNPRRAFRRFSP